MSIALSEPTQSAIPLLQAPPFDLAQRRRGSNGFRLRCRVSALSRQTDALPTTRDDGGSVHPPGIVLILPFETLVAESCPPGAVADFTACATPVRRSWMSSPPRRWCWRWMWSRTPTRMRIRKCRLASPAARMYDRALSGPRRRIRRTTSIFLNNEKSGLTI